MFAIERQQHITQQLLKDKRVLVSALSHSLGVTEETIRRDLKELERAGLAVRSHGGAVLAAHPPPLAAPAAPPGDARPRMGLGPITAELIDDHMLIMADGSDAARAAVNCLDKHQDVTILTYSWRIINELAERDNLRFIASGGEVRTQDQTFAGADALRTINRYHADLAIIGAAALHARFGCMSDDAAACDLQAAMLSRSSGHIVIADSRSFDTSLRYTLIPLADLQQLVTDQAPSSQWLKILNHYHITLHY